MLVILWAATATLRAYVIHRAYRVPPKSLVLPLDVYASKAPPRPR